ncbi:MAG: hypothetical protein ABH829_00625 [archaeon]
MRVKYAFAAVLLLSAIAMAQTAEDAQAAIAAAGQDISVMSKAGFNVKIVNDTYFQALTANDRGYYGQVVQLCNQVSSTKKAAFEAFDVINEAKNKVYEDSKKGLDVTDSNTVLALADRAFSSADYTEAMRLAQEAVSIQHQPVRARLSAFLRTNWKQVTAFFAVLALIAIISYKPLHGKYVNFRLKSLSEESKELDNLISAIDEKYYKHKTIGDEEYRHMRTSHEARKAKVHGEIARLQSKKR